MGTTLLNTSASFILQMCDTAHQMLAQMWDWNFWSLMF